MSEKLSGNHEALGAKVEALRQRPENRVNVQAELGRQAEDAEKARQAVAETNRSESQPNPLERLQQAENASQAPSPSYINRELKQITLRRELKNIRRRLPVPQRALSRLVHQPVVRLASEAAGKTVSRPSGLLGGGFIALVGSSAYLYLAKHIGFEYNYGVFLALFAGGFALGLFIELAVSLGFRRRL